MGDRYTIVGGRGFIGAALAATLRASGADVAILAHREPLPAGSLGHVVYASGVASSSAQDASYAFGAHVEGLRRVIDHARFDSLLYLSSTRVYDGSPDTAESAALAVLPEDGQDVYRASKIAGETLCLALPAAAVRVARLSNVVGTTFESPLFVSDVLRQAARTGRAVLHTTRASAKDYITIDDACRYLSAIARTGRARLYNVASGKNVENGAICDTLAACGVAIEIAGDAKLSIKRPIDVRRLQSEFGPPRDDLVAELPALLERFVAHAASAVG
jgi:nucleoside-diphosphate-sugar epimerase